MTQTQNFRTEAARDVIHPDSAESRESAMLESAMLESALNDAEIAELLRDAIAARTVLNNTLRDLKASTGISEATIELMVKVWVLIASARSGGVDALEDEELLSTLHSLSRTNDAPPRLMTPTTRRLQIGPYCDDDEAQAVIPGHSEAPS